MNATFATRDRTNSNLESFAAELTDAAFPVALQHAMGANWLDLKLELWKALDRAVNKWTPELCEDHG
jgi:hypothetical protein